MARLNPTLESFARQITREHRTIARTLGHSIADEVVYLGMSVHSVHLSPFNGTPTWITEECHAYRARILTSVGL